MKKIIVCMSLTIVLLTVAVSAYAAWLVYSKPAFRGRVIDAETKAPIEGAVVVVMYHRHTLISGPGGGDTTVFKVKEVLTDRKGDFYFPPYTTLINPFFQTDQAYFIIYKPGYLKGPPYVNVAHELFFSIDEIGKVGEIREPLLGGGFDIYRGPLGIVELKKGDDWPDTPTDYRSKELPLLFRAINKERKNRGLQGEEK